ncbi:surface antigen family protein [Anaplasma phagocytophilum str. ApNP]|uniref:Surface antigen family protein n=2 Tax=Anaplasma phagocytophilum TaxID=948 RepID=A0A0F3NG58_ANAPH|nr:surface antigen family protein [Anaplasma phagocytophilum str. ApMUC09]KJV67035.1 surface antigen family protein [Anaplasma phagocytophilum str. ApNP]SCV64070.1 Major surface antigen 4 precursor [Anaplasma phagocytophilum]
MTQRKATGGSNGFGIYAGKTTADGTDTNNDTSLCGGHGTTGSNSGNRGGKESQVLRDFIRDALKGGNENWPTSTKSTGAESDTKNDNANAVAKDLVEKLSSEEKTIVAGLLAKTIEGGEVVEIRAVSSTSVMVNACYDLLSEGLGVVPYACVGLGGNFVGVVDGIHYTNHL